MSDNSNNGVGTAWNRTWTVGDVITAEKLTAITPLVVHYTVTDWGEESGSLVGTCDTNSIDIFTAVDNDREVIAKIDLSAVVNDGLNMGVNGSILEIPVTDYFTEYDNEYGYNGSGSSVEFLTTIIPSPRDVVDVLFWTIKLIQEEDDFTLRVVSSAVSVLDVG